LFDCAIDYLTLRAKKVRSPKTSSTIINQLLIRRKNTRPDRTLNILPATADTQNTAPEPGQTRGSVFEVCVRVNGAIASSNAIPNISSIFLGQIFQPNL
jgi:hypothetical protein